MTKSVRVYSLACEEMCIPEYQSYIDVNFTQGDFTVDGWWHRTQKDQTENYLTIDRIEVQEFEEYIVPEHFLPYVEGCYRSDDIRVHKTYIAIPPELEKLISSKWEDKLCEVNKELNNFKKENNTLIEDNKVWWEQPWYKRVWVSLAGKGGLI